MNSDFLSEKSAICWAPYLLTCMGEDHVLLFTYCGTLVLCPTGVLMVVNVTCMSLFCNKKKLYLLRIQYRFLSLITIIVPAG